MTQTDVQMRKARGRLSRHVQNKLGETLHAMFDEIVKEGVPDRFQRILHQMEGGRGQGNDLDEPIAKSGAKSGELEGVASKPDQLMRTQGPDRPFPKPEDKGSS